MYKEYQKPDAEYVSFVAQEEITVDPIGDVNDYIDADTGVESSVF